MIVRRTILLGVLLSLLIAAPRASAGAPRGFLGVVPQGPLSSGDFKRISAAGLELRLTLSLPEIEPSPGVFDFHQLDRVFEETSARGTRVLPVLYGSPPWIFRDPARPPLSQRALAAWREFVKQLVSRYGPGGGFWDGRERKEPVHRWQVWNEPNFRIFWRPLPSPRAYARLLRVSAGAIREVDPNASIVAAGVAPIEHELPPWEFLRRVLAVPGTARLVDQVALHPYAATLAGVEYELGKTRGVLRRAGLEKMPILVSELGAASNASAPTAFNLGPSGQARFLEQSLARLRQQRHRWRIGGVFWYSWRDGASPDPHCPFCQYSGLFDSNDAPKPAWWALKRVVLPAGGH